MSRVKDFSKGKEVEVEVAGRPTDKTRTKEKTLDSKDVKKEKEDKLRADIGAVRSEMSNERE
jgi:hypothetical protein